MTRMFWVRFCITFCC